MSFDLAEQLQTPIIILSDLDLGMNDHVCDPLKWNDETKYKRGKILDADALDKIEKFGRYLDIDGDALTYRTIPGTHPTKGSFFTRGSSRDEYAIYTEDGNAYKRNMDRLSKKWETIKSYVPKPELFQKENLSKFGMLFFGTSHYAALEARDYLAKDGLSLDAIRLKSFPFPKEVEDFIEFHLSLIHISEPTRPY